MKFAHLADCHIGGWREPELKQLSLDSFRYAIDYCIKNHTAFILISGDLFNTALPQIDLIRETAEILEKAKSNDIEVYIIPGSHDFSPSGKTMLDVLQASGLLINVMKIKDNNLEFTLDKTNVKITGMYGKKGGLEVTDYQTLNKAALEKESGFKIFMFHTALEEFKPNELEKVECLSYEALPKNFNYYAGGHVHYLYQTQKPGYGIINYPGPTFPNNFKELEELKQGTFFIIDDKLSLTKIPIKLKETLTITIDANDKTPYQVTNEIYQELSTSLIENKIVLLRIEGTLKEGKPSEINYKKLDHLIKKAFSFLKNTSKLTTKEMVDLETNTENTSDLETEIISKSLGRVPLANISKEQEEDLAHILMNLLAKEKEEGEKQAEFEFRLLNDLKPALKIE